MAVLVLVLTDVEGSTRMWEREPDAMSGAMARHHEIVHGSIEVHGGWRPVDQGEGDAVFAAFDSAQAAVAAVLEFQAALAQEPWPASIDIRARVAVHAGEVAERGGNLFGTPVNRCARIRSLAAGGQVLVSAPVFELTRDRLPDGASYTDLGEHRLKDLGRPEHLYQAIAPALLHSFPPLADLDRARHNLPVQTSEFVGREKDVTRLTALVSRERLVTLTGFGGTGKTRLALQVAAELADGNGDGVWFVDLGAVTDPAAIFGTMAGVLDVKEGEAGLEASLFEWLKEKYLLLVLDNLEQLLPAAAAQVDLLRRTCPDVRLLVTSRRPVQIRGEHLYPLEPLDLPPADLVRQGGDPAALSTYAAVTLFLTRALEVRPDFELTIGNAAAVAGICVRLDGLPLALELAAARLRVLSVDALLARLERALSVLTNGSRDLPGRQQTLRAAIAWSYDALEPIAKTLLDRLSVFPGSFTLEAAEAVAADGEVIDEYDVLDLLTTLIDASLVRTRRGTDGGAQARYSLLIPIREFAAERLSAVDARAARDRHATFFSAALTLRLDWEDEDTDRVYATGIAEDHNIRAALAHTHETHNTELELNTIADLLLVLLSAGRLTDLEALTSHAETHLGHIADPLVRVRLLCQRAVRLKRAGLLPAARDAAEHALEAARELGEPSMLALALCWAADVTADTTVMHELLQEAEEVAHSLPARGNVNPAHMVWEEWGIVASQRGYLTGDRVIAFAERSVARSSGLERPRTIYNLAYFLGAAGRFTEAVATLEELRDGEWSEFLTPRIEVGLYGGITDFRIALDDLRGAKEALAELEALVLRVDDPSMAAYLPVIHAILERGADDRPAARARLDAYLAEHRADPSTLPSLVAAHLLAVVYRELGDADNSARVLEQGWLAAIDAPFDPEEQNAYLLERAMQLFDQEPETSVRLIAHVREHWAPLIATIGVHYDVDELLDELRGRLGAARVQELIDASLGQPFVDPFPGRAKSDSHQNH